MSTLIAFASKYGSTESCAHELAKKISDRVDLCNLKQTKNVDLSKYDRVIIGGSIYAGNIQKEVKEFCAQNLSTLQTKKLGLYICCMQEGEGAEKQIATAFPEELVKIAVVKDYFGGEFRVKKMNFLEKFIVKQVAKAEKKPITDMSKDISSISPERISRFAMKIS